MEKARIQLIVDSCCDLTPELREKIDARVAPLKVRVAGGAEYVDDGTADIPALIADMARSKQGASSSCPSTEEYAAHMRAAEECFVVTLSSRLSGSYNAARVAADLVREDYPEKKIHVFDSESASAGEVQLALFLHDRIEQGMDFEKIIPLADAYISKMRTLFVLEDLGNFVKSGRLSKVSGLLASVLSLCPIMGDNGHGDIKLVAKARGIQNSLRKLTQTVAELTAQAEEKSLRLVLAYCNCPERAEALKRALLEKCAALREILLMPTGALSTMYANDGGVIVAF
ncbi:MAG TPA: DegV family protein [Firmicutes bacterium]|nr:DegV family protein [Bacillota bacterium]